MTPGKKQSGVALVTALLIVALTTLMAVTLASRQYMDVRRTGNIMLADQAYLYTLALESFAGQLLKAYRDNQQQKHDDLEQFKQATLLFQMIPVENGSVSATVEFPEAKFNVNTLIDKDGKVKEWERDYYDRLLGLVMQELGMDFSLKEQLVDSLLDWIDPDDEARTSGAEDSTYSSRPIPYQAANRMMSSVSELRLVEGYTKELLEGFPGDEKSPAIPGLLNYLTALPDRNSTININLIDWEEFPTLEVSKNNTAPQPKKAPKMILAMANGMDDKMATELMDSRPFKDVSEFTGHAALDAIKNAPPPGGAAGAGGTVNPVQALSAHIDVQSSYFLLQGRAIVGDSKISLNSLLYANTSGTKLEVVSRAIGTPGI